MMALFLFAAPALAAEEPALRRMIGQMLATGFVGAGGDHPWLRQVEGQIARGEIGGVLFLRRNIGKPSELLALNERLHRAADGGPPLLSCIDQEGGAVRRLLPRDGYADLPSARTTGALGLPQAAALYARTAKELAALGFNCNLAPVADLDIDPSSPAIGRSGRAYSADPELAAGHVGAFAQAHASQGVMTAIKHFPGHGSAREDSHEQFADVTRSWSRNELEPYRDLFGQGYGGMVMTGHIVHRGLDAKGMPATLSPAMTEGLLRRELGWEGVVITDDLQMIPVARLMPVEAAALAAIRAGADILLFANDENPDLAIPVRVIDAVEEAAKRDAGLAARIAQSYRRILEMKQRLRKG